MIINVKYTPSKVYLLHFCLIFSLLEKWIIKDTQDLLGRHLVVGQLLLLIHLPLSPHLLCRRGLVLGLSGLALHPHQKLLIGFIGIEGIKHVGLLAEESVNLLVGSGVLVNHL